MILTQILYKKVGVTMALNGALAGLVAITAEPLQPSMLQAIIIGGVGVVIVVFAVPLLDKLKIDVVVGAIPVHLLAGILGYLHRTVVECQHRFRYADHRYHLRRRLHLHRLRHPVVHP